MPNIDTLSIQFNTNGTETAIKNIKSMGYAVRNLAQSVKSIDANKLSAFTASMETLKKSVPTEAQTSRMVAFSEAVKSLSSAIGTANISSFSRDMSTLGDAVETFKRSSVNSIKNVVTAMSELQTQAQTTANVISNAIPQKSTPISRGDNKSTLSQTREMVASLDKAESRVDAINSKFKGIFVPTKQFKTLEDQADKVAKKYDELRSKMQEALNSGSMSTSDTRFKQQSAELDALRNQYNDLILKQRELAISGQGIELNPRVLQSLNAFRNGFTSVINLVRNGFVAGIRAANSHLKSFAARVKETAIAAKNAITSGHKATDMAKKFANEITRVGKMLKLMITRMVLRKIIAEVSNGFKSLAIHSQEFNQSVSSMMNGAKKLSYSFAAMVSPLLNALAPAIVYVINLLVRLANAIQQVFAVFTGATSWNRAKDFTEDWASNLQDANKNAKELKKTVLGFDELNQLQEKSSGSGSGNDIADMFETVNIDPKWKEFADWLKKMWEIGDFSELGKKLGTQLRDLLESIPWDKIRATSHKLGESLATLINGFVEVERLGYDIGKTIAQSVNTVFEFINGFVHRLHWDSIGKFIADTFNGFFEKIDWALIKDTVVTGLEGIGIAIQNFIETFHWDNVSTFITNGVNTVVSGIRAFFENIDWLDLGQKLGDQLKKTIEGIDWYDLGAALGDIIQAAIDVFSGLIDGINVDDVVDALTELVKGFFDKVDTQQAGENIGKLIQKLIDIIKGFWVANKDTLVTELGNFFGGIFGALDKGDLAKILSGVLGAAMLVGIANVGWTMLGTFLAAKLTAMLTSQAIATAIGTSAATVAGSTTVTAATASAGASLAAIFKTAFIGGLAGIAGVVAGLVVGEPVKRGLFDLGEAIAQAVGRDDAAEKIRNMHEAYNEMGGTIDMIKDGFKEFYELLGGDVERSIYALEDDAGVVQKVVDDLGNTVIEFVDDADNVRTSAENLNAPVITITDNLDQFGRKVGETGSACKKSTDAIEGLTKKTTENKKATDDNNDAFGGLIKTVNDTASSISGLGDSTKSALNTATSSFESAQKSGQAMSDELKKSFEGISAGAANLGRDTKVEFDNMELEVANSQLSISGSLQTLSKGVTDTTNDMKDAFKEKEWTFDGVGNGLTKTFEKAKEGIKGVWNSIAEKLNGEHSLGEGKFKINLPKFATGGFPEDGLFMANHHELVGSFSNGKTAVANNGQIIAGIETGVYSAMSKVMSQTSGSSQYIANEIIVDGDVIARTVSKAQDRQNRRFSPATT